MPQQAMPMQRVWQRAVAMPLTQSIRLSPQAAFIPQSEQQISTNAVLLGLVQLMEPMGFITALWRLLIKFSVLFA